MTANPSPGSVTVAPAGAVVRGSLETAPGCRDPEAPGSGSEVRHPREDVRPRPLVDERAQALLAEVGRRLFGSLNLRRCLHTVAEVAVHHLADAVAVVGPPTRPAGPRVRLAADGRVEEDHTDRDEIADVPGMPEALHGYPPAPSRWLDPATVPGWVLPAGFGPAGDVLLVPLPGYAGAGGALVLARRAGGARFTQDDEALARVFAARAGAAISAAALHREQSEALAVLQAELVPPRLPYLDGLQLVGSHQPAEHSLLTGGDFYDVFPPADAGAPAVVVLGDVCGKGAAAAALTGKVRQTLQALHQVERHPAALLTMLNDVLLHPDRDGPFVTLVVGSLTVAPDGRVDATFATGGHPVPLVLRGDGTVEEVPAAGTLLGVVPDVRIGTASVSLAPGDLCLLYSDGITEARGGDGGTEQYGEHRLRESLSHCCGMPADAVLDRLRGLVCDWVHGGERDDIALLGIRAQGSSR